MKNEEAEAKVVAYKIARDLEGLSLGIAVKTLTTVLVTFILHSTDPKKVADFIISNLKRAVEEANDDRNLVDLSNVWHDASEIPEEYPILCLDKFGDLLIYEYGYPEFVEFNDISKWAYVSDLLPKGCEK